VTKGIILKITVVTLLMLPASCAAGYVAVDLMGQRTDLHIETGGKLWLENLLWLASLAFMIGWAYYADKIWKGR
jgi:uncharacterized paraquat-inducible protein A